MSLRLEVVGLFPTPLARAERLLDGALVEELAQEIAGAPIIANTKSAQLSHTQIVEPSTSPTFMKAAALIKPRLEDFGMQLFGEKLEWSIKEVWANILETGGHQSVHNHANSFISGVLYLTQPHPSSNLVFHKSVGAANFVFTNQNKATKFGPYNGGKWMIPKLGAGDLVLFPSYLLHEVPVNQGARRMTLAFNAIPHRLESFGYSITFS